jgi:hypothetical protein
VNVSLLLNRRLEGGIDRRQCNAERLLQVDHTAEADRQAKEVVEQRWGFAIADSVAAMQHGNGGGRLRPKAARWQVYWSLGGYQVPAAGTTHRMIMVRRDVGADLGQFPDVLRAHGTGIAQAGRQGFLAVGADSRMMVAYCVDLIGRWIRPLMARMAWLTARLSST